MSKTEIDKKLEEIDKKLATHDFYIPQLVQDVRTLKSNVDDLSEDIGKLKKKLRKLESKVEQIKCGKIIAQPRELGSSLENSLQVNVDSDTKDLRSSVLSFEKTNPFSLLPSMGTTKNKGGKETDY